jgi:alpha-L-arabinofuranosidase
MITRLHRFGGLILCMVGFVGPAVAQSDQPIFTDSLASGWQDWSWATDNLACTSTVHSGTYSISVTTSNYQALYLSHDDFSTTGYSNLTFWINGGLTGGQPLQVQVLLGGVAQRAVSLAPLLSNTWQQIVLSLASLGAANQPNMDGFWIQSRTGANEPTFYVDDIALTAAPPPAIVHVNVNATQTVRTVDARMFGVNTAIWDGVFDTANTIGMFTSMNNQALRFPGGSASDDYHWATNTSDTNTWTWATSFDQFADVATNTHAQVFITVNYGSGTPTEAASWVQYSNVTKQYGFKYWEIGNECYGSWETDLNSPPNDPYTYASRFQSYWTQMKEMDPTIKIGAVVITGEDSYSTYTNHPATNPRTGQTHNGWTPVLLATLNSFGVTPDFVIYHRYAQAPSAENDATLLQSSVTWSNDAADLRQQLSDYLGAPATNVELVCTENNSVYTNPGKQTTSLVNGLFWADSIGNALQTEFNALIWWDTRNGQETGNNNDPSLYGWRQYGDYGITDSNNPAVPADRYPTYYVARLLQYFARGNDHVVPATSDYSFLSVYAAARTNGLLTLLVINKSSTNSLNASLSIDGYLPNTNAVVYSYGIPQDEAACTGIGSADIALTNFTSAATDFSWSFPPYSASVICLSNPSPPTITTFVRNTNGNTTITWANQGGWIYIVQDCDSMGGPWQTINSETNASLTNLTLFYTDTTASLVTQRFYRVGLVNP